MGWRSNVIFITMGFNDGWSDDGDLRKMNGKMVMKQVNDDGQMHEISKMMDK